MQENNTLNQSVIIENRKQISISGVSECLGFDEDTILLDTKLGKLTVKGSNLHIISFDTESGEFSAEGRVHAIGYTQTDSKNSFLSKIFR